MANIRKLKRKCSGSNFLYQAALLVSILFLCIRSLRMYENDLQRSLPELPSVEPSLLERPAKEKPINQAQYERICFTRLKEKNRSDSNEFMTTDGRRVVIYPKETYSSNLTTRIKTIEIKKEPPDKEIEDVKPKPTPPQEEPEEKKPTGSSKSEPTNDEHFENSIVVVSVACKGSDANATHWQRRQLGVLMKSIVMLSRKAVTFYLFSDAKMFFLAADKFVKTWPKVHKNKFKIIKRDTWYPSDLLTMKTLFRPCSSQRLFLPSMLPDVEKAIYMDTDMLFLRPIDDLWDILETDISGQMFGGFAPRMLKVTDPSLPYYGKREVNAGLFLMNLQQLRQYPGQWRQVVQDIYKSADIKASLGRDPDDQDILNIMTTNYPHRFFNLSCEWNYRFFMCEDASGDKCPEAQSRGISLLHGLGHSFMNCTKAPKFCKTFQVAEDYRLRESIKEKFFNPIENNLKEISQTHKTGYRCKMSTYFDEMLLKQIRNYAND